MKRLAALVATGLAVLTLSSLAGSAPTGPTPAPVAQADLEKRVAELEALVSVLHREHEETKQKLDQTLVHLNAQADAAEALLDTLQRSEELGFTKGINFESREVMLAGFRSYWSGADQGLPKPTPKKKTD